MFIELMNGHTKTEKVIFLLSLATLSLVVNFYSFEMNEMPLSLLLALISL